MEESRLGRLPRLLPKGLKKKIISEGLRSANVYLRGSARIYANGKEFQKNLNMEGEEINNDFFECHKN